jgi:hypothetical protein
VVALPRNEQGSWIDTAGKWISLIVGIITIWQFVTGLDLVPGPTPLEVAERVGNEITEPDRSGVDGGGDGGGGGGGDQGEPLSPPSNLQLAGDCDNGYTLTWDPVEGAVRYIIERDGDFEGSEIQLVHQFEEFPDGGTHEYRVIANDDDPSIENDSGPSEESVTTGPCSF